MPVSADPSIEMQDKSEIKEHYHCKWFDFPEQVAGQDGFGDRARQVQQAFGHHPGPGDVVDGADVGVDVGQVPSHQPRLGRSQW